MPVAELERCQAISFVTSSVVDGGCHKAVEYGLGAVDGFVQLNEAVLGGWQVLVVVSGTEVNVVIQPSSSMKTVRSARRCNMRKRGKVLRVFSVDECRVSAIELAKRSRRYDGLIKRGGELLGSFQDQLKFPRQS